MFRSFLIIYVMLTSAADANNRTYTIACVDKDSIHGFTFQYAFELFSPKLNNSGLILQPNLIGGVQEVYCSSLAATVDAFLLITQEKGANGFIGPDCPKAMDMFGILASKSNHMLPLLGYELTFVDSYDYNPTDYQVLHAAP